MPNDVAPARQPRASYHVPAGGLPPQTQLMTDRAVFTEAYAVIPKGVMRDIVVSYFPFWTGARAWVLARPLSGFAETFSQYIVEVQPEGGSDRPETDPGAEAVLFVVDGSLSLTVNGARHTLQPGGYAYIPPASDWSVKNGAGVPLRFHWIRKKYKAVDGLEPPDVVISSDHDIAPAPMPARMANGPPPALSTRRTCATTCMSPS